MIPNGSSVMRAGLIGHPVGHSISPEFQQAAFDELGLDVHYERWDTPQDLLEQRVRQLRASEFLGANVTVPHKQAVLPLLDESTDDVRLLGATNTIVKRDGLLVGYNTDVGGFRRALREELDFDAAGCAAAVLGAGGGARAVIAALSQEGATRILVLNRTPERADRLVAELGPGLTARLKAGDLGETLNRRLAGCDLVVNCTSLGLAGSALAGRLAVDPDGLPGKAAVVDIVANPLWTPLMLAARESGHAVLGGLAMLVHQGALSFSLWTGQPAPLKTMMRAARVAMGLDETDGALP